MRTIIDMGGRLELFADDYLVDIMNNVVFRLHEPVRQPNARSPLPFVPYGTVIMDGDKYRAYYRDMLLGYDGVVGDGNEGEITCYAESTDGIEWTFPELGIYDSRSANGGNVILAGQSPCSHNFSPFLDTRPDVEPEARFKALAGTDSWPEPYRGGLWAFKSADGLHWTKIQETPVIKYPPDGRPLPFDSQNVSFWSEVEKKYVCYFRTWNDQTLRTISRTTSQDFINWNPPVCTNVNLPGEELYTSQTHPYFRAPHIYIALPMRYSQGLLMGKPVEGNNGSSDILFMTMRADETSYRRIFKEAFIRPGLDEKRWTRKANFACPNVVPTGPAEMSIYHINGDRYTLRTDGFISVHAGDTKGELVTKPLTFDGDALFVNFSTGVVGALRVEIQDASGQAIPGFALDDCPIIVGDSIERRAEWLGNPSLGALAGKTVRLRFEIYECDLYSFRFGKQ